MTCNCWDLEFPTGITILEFIFKQSIKSCGYWRGAAAHKTPSYFSFLSQSVKPSPYLNKTFLIFNSLKFSLAFVTKGLILSIACTSSQKCDKTADWYPHPDPSSKTFSKIFPLDFVCDIRCSVILATI